MLDLDLQNLFDCGRNFPKRQEVAVNRTELVDKVASATGLDKHHAEAAVKAVIDTVVAETRSGEKVSVFGFGTFTPTARAARTGRNPQTGAPVKIKASKSVRFAPAAAYKLSLNSRGGAKKAAAPPAKKAVPAKKAAPAAKKAAPAKAAPSAVKASGVKKASATKKAVVAPVKKAAKTVKSTAAKATKSKSAKK